MAQDAKAISTGANLMEKAPDTKTMKELARSVSPSFKSLAFRPETLEATEKFCKTICATQIVPQAYQGKWESALAAIYMGLELGLPPMAALRGIAVINGKPSIYGDLALAVVQASPAYEWHEELLDEKNMAAMCRVKRKNNPKPFEAIFTKADAEKAGLWNKPGTWQNYPKRMLAMRARGFCLRNGFSDALSGMHLAEEFEGVVMEAEVIKPNHTETVKLGDILKEPETKPAPEKETATNETVPSETPPYTITVKTVTKKDAMYFIYDMQNVKFTTLIDSVAKVAKELIDKQASFVMDANGNVSAIWPTPQRDLIS